jgi:hypothetical protein
MSWFFAAFVALVACDRFVDEPLRETNAPEPRDAQCVRDAATVGPRSTRLAIASDCKLPRS